MAIYVGITFDNAANYVMICKAKTQDRWNMFADVSTFDNHRLHYEARDHSELHDDVDYTHGGYCTTQAELAIYDGV